MGDTTITGWRKYASMEPLAFTVFAAFSISGEKFIVIYNLYSLYFYHII